MCRVRLGGVVGCKCWLCHVALKHALCCADLLLPLNPPPQDSLSGQAKTMMFMHVAPEVCVCVWGGGEPARRGTGVWGPTQPTHPPTLTPSHPTRPPHPTPPRPAPPHPRMQMSSVSETLSTLNFGRNVTEVTLGAAKKNAESGAAFEAKERAAKAEREAAGASRGAAGVC